MTSVNEEKLRRAAERAARLNRPTAPAAREGRRYTAVSRAARGPGFDTLGAHAVRQAGGTETAGPEPAPALDARPELSPRARGPAGELPERLASAPFDLRVLGRRPAAVTPPAAGARRVLSVPPVLAEMASGRPVEVHAAGVARATTASAYVAPATAGNMSPAAGPTGAVGMAPRGGPLADRAITVPEPDAGGTGDEVQWRMLRRQRLDSHR